MTPEIRKLLAEVEALARRVAALEREIEKRERQQLTRPLDTASQLVVKEAMEQQGFNYP